MCVCVFLKYIIYIHFDLIILLYSIILLIRRSGNYLVKIKIHQLIFFLNSSRHNKYFPNYLYSIFFLGRNLFFLKYLGRNLLFR